MFHLKALLAAAVLSQAVALPAASQTTLNRPVETFQCGLFAEPTMSVCRRDSGNYAPVVVVPTRWLVELCKAYAARPVSSERTVFQDETELRRQCALAMGFRDRLPQN